ncbi:F-UL17 protein [Chelonid alphaherpesvirus 5]|uniref:F-UL17 protein n=1 Tax=Chelonid alphaherpesvirus 5 TaxID=702736 RepID=V5NWQ5_9ALPH|nr:F-UL17 protein [Chelonid alphaherpesvirus 5]AHA93337.1 F-UL17 protein [Chelonid alphaherpesvirus 5]
MVEAHARGELGFGGASSSEGNVLVHLILPDALLAAQGIAALLDAPFQVRAQTRFHGCGSCSYWRPIPAYYERDDFLAALLLPNRKIFRLSYAEATSGSVSGGGLFISVPLYCRDNGGVNWTFDDFNTLVLRVVPLQDHEGRRDIYLNYGETLGRSPEYSVDEGRWRSLAEQARRWLFKRPEALRRDPDLSDNLKVPNEQADADLLRGEIYLSSTASTPKPPALRNLPQPADPAAAAAKAIFADRLTREKQKKLSRRMDGVAAGLSSLARFSNAREGGKTFATRDVGPLEPPSHARHLETNNLPPPPKPLEEILYDRSSEATVTRDPVTSLRDAVERALRALGEPPDPSRHWRDGLISVRSGRDYLSGETFYVVNYQNSLLPQRPAVSGLGPLLELLRLQPGENDPARLKEPLRTRALDSAPVMRCPLYEPAPHCSLFVANAERDTLYRVKKLLLVALAESLRQALRTSALRQIIALDLPADLDYEALAEIVPAALHGLLVAEAEAPLDKFWQGALARALAAEEDEFGDAYLFDRYNLSGEVQKLPFRSAIVNFRPVREGQYECFRTNGRGEESEAPGEFYLHLWLGFRPKDLSAALVFPGGFGAEFSYRRVFERSFGSAAGWWRDRLRERFSWRAARPRGSEAQICASLTP